MTNTIHRRQLFHWIGAHIKESATKENGARKYVEALKTSVVEGLWFTISNQESELNELLTDIKSLNMICFTDNRISECAYHSTKYGKMALGFPKKYVINNCGMPVNYVSHKKQYNSYMDAIHKINKHITALNDSDLIEQWNVIKNHIKPISNVANKMQKNIKTTATYKASKSKHRVTHRVYGPELKYYIEHEWRIVLSSKLLMSDKVSVVNGNYRLKYNVETDLFSLVLPSRLVYEIIKSDEKELYEKISHSSNLNTFIIDEVDQL